MPSPTAASTTQPAPPCASSRAPLGAYGATRNYGHRRSAAQANRPTCLPARGPGEPSDHVPARADAGQRDARLRRRTASPGLTDRLRESGLHQRRLEREPASVGLGSATSHAATAVIADAVTLLSNQWDDNELVRVARTTTARRTPPTLARTATTASRSSAARAIASVPEAGRRAALPRTSARTAARTTSCGCSRGDAGAGRHRSTIVARWRRCLQPPGGRHVQVLHGTVVQRPDPQFHLRHRLPHAGAAAAEHADVPRHERHRLLAGAAAGQVTARSQFLRAC